MRTRRLSALLAATAVLCFGANGVSLAAPPEEHGAPELATSPAHYMPARHAKPVGSTASANMTLHGGNLMTDSVTKAIFWGAGAAGADKVSGLTAFYQGWSGSNYAHTVDEYKGVNGLYAGATSTFDGVVIDSANAAPTGAPSTSAVLAEVARTVSNPVANGYYAVYGATRRGSAGYCAWHSYGTINQVPVQFAWFFNLDGDAGCDPADTRNVYTQGTEALANVSAHELAEAVTDPRNGGWYDRRGMENADKCAWTFNVPTVRLSNGTEWKLQGEWSNAGFLSGVGVYRNSSGQLGCLDGH